MALMDSDDRTRQRRAKTEQAIALATKGRWEEAAQLNRDVVELAPSDIDAHNRLGKALMELGRYAEAREAYTGAAKLDPMNSIAGRNLQRLSKLIEEGAPAPAASAVDPRLFIEESGKTTVTVLTELRKNESVDKLTAGDELKFDIRGAQIWVTTPAGVEIGRIEPKLEQDLVKLFKLGNKYSVFVTAADQVIHVIIREVRRAPGMGNRPSFRPTAASEGTRPYAREGLLRYNDAEEEEEEDDAPEEEEDDDEEEAEPAAAAAEGVEVAPLQDIAEAEAEDEDAEDAT